jgi:hypothetical protein
MAVAQASCLLFVRESVLDRAGTGDRANSSRITHSPVVGIFASHWATT